MPDPIIIGNATLINGDCLAVMPTLAADSLDAIVTDPPYGLSFMGKDWDHGIPGTAFWVEALRVAKPGAHLLAFGGSRTFHRLVCAIEDAGFEIRDQIMWIYGSGFPKSSNQTDDWEGWGTALKPAHEPIVVARKPLVGTVPANLAKYGVGALNIDGCRVGTERREYKGGMGRFNETAQSQGFRPYVNGVPSQSEETFIAEGRWPANVIHDGSDEVLAAFPDRKTTWVSPTHKNNRTGEFLGALAHPGAQGFNDSGSAARFFYCAKTSKQDRDDGLTTPEQPVVTFATANGTSGKPSSISEGRNTSYKNTHPTVKPTPLMQYLTRLVTPPGGVVLDPFMGSGSTGRGAVLEGFSFIGIEQEPEYLAIAAARVRAAHEQQKQIELLADLPAPAPFIPRQAPSAHQVQLFEAA